MNLISEMCQFVKAVADKPRAHDEQISNIKLGDLDANEFEDFVAPDELQNELSVEHRLKFVIKSKDKTQSA